MPSTFYDYIPHHKHISPAICYAQPADNYTEDEIVQLYALCNSQYEKDLLTDRLYLGNSRKRRGRKKDEYYYYSARQMAHDSGFVSTDRDKRFG